MIKFLSCCLLTGALLLSPLTRPASGQELPPEVQFDLLSRQIEVFLERDQHEEALVALKKMRELDLPVDFSISFYEGKLLFDSGEFAAAEEVLLDYLIKTGRKSEHYEEAINLVVWAREEQLVQKTAKQEAIKVKKQAVEAANNEAQILKNQIALLAKLSSDQHDLGKWVLTRQQQCGTCQGCTSNYDETHVVYDECRGLFSVDFRQCAVKVRQGIQITYKKDCLFELPKERDRLRNITGQVNALQAAVDEAELGDGFLP